MTYEEAHAAYCNNDLCETHRVRHLDHNDPDVRRCLSGYLRQSYPVIARQPSSHRILHVVTPEMENYITLSNHDDVLAVYKRGKRGWRAVPDEMQPPEVLALAAML